jgi:hypothetical protein
MATPTAQPTLPRWLKPANRIVILLQRLGLAIGTMRVLSVPGRKSGQLRTTPVSLLVIDGHRYIVGGMLTADWVQNAQAANWGILAHGRKQERVALIELAEVERIPILRAFPRLIPHGVSYFQRLYGLPSAAAELPDAFAALASRCTVFRIEPPPRKDSGARS